MHWKKKSEAIPQTITELQEIILGNREIPSNSVAEFLQPTHPSKLTATQFGLDTKKLQKAVTLIKKTIQQDKKIVIFGDYDVDGICASALLWQVLFKLYRAQHPAGINHPVPFIPHREKHGYGITQSAIDEIREAHAPQLIITVDNGIVAHEPIAYARQQGIDVIITDHHQPETKQGKSYYPKAESIVHTTKLCGATVAWVLAQKLDQAEAQKHLDLTGIATIADQVPLLESNRSFARFGIEALQESTNLGIIELCKRAQITQKEITEMTIGFVIAPRINAMGRLEHGLDALRLLCTQNKKQAHELASLLSDTNSSRQDLTKQMFEEAKQQIVDQTDEHLLIVYSDTFHEGILGLIAGGLVEEFHKPAIAISLGTDLAKASARSIPGVNIVDIIRQARADLTTVGGHPMAAGFSFLPQNLKKVRSKLYQLAKQSIRKEELEKSLVVECQIPVSLVSVETIQALGKFSPYGMKNPQPVFEIRNLQVMEVRVIGASKEHIKFKVKDAGNPTATAFDCLGWRMAQRYSEIKQHDTISIVGALETNEWRDTVYPQVVLKDVLHDEAKLS